VRSERAQQFFFPPLLLWLKALSHSNTRKNEKTKGGD
jgi:hypothetical protein